MIGILLTNIGTPDAPTPTAVRRYLQEFLSDPRIVELPTWLWRPILYGLILPFRSKYSARLYQKIWSDNGSPLLHITQLQAQQLQDQLTIRGHEQVKVSLGMRYGRPSIAQAMEELRQAQVKKIIVLPLFPQYSAATVGSSFDAIAKVLKTWRSIPQLAFINQYAEHPLYIEALAAQIKRHQNPAAQKLLFSFHGIPKHCITAGDPYYDACHSTAKLVAEKLGYPTEKWMVVFQSRFGKQEWLQPYCDKTLQAFPKQDIKLVDVVCPGFAADCLETLEEMAQTNQKLFIAAGGTKLNYIPALNAIPDHIQALIEIIKPYIDASTALI